MNKHSIKTDNTIYMRIIGQMSQEGADRAGVLTILPSLLYGIAAVMAAAAPLLWVLRGG